MTGNLLNVELIGGPYCGRTVEWEQGQPWLCFIYAVQCVEFRAFYNIEDGEKTAFFQKAEAI